MDNTTKTFFSLVTIDSPSGEEKNVSEWLQKWLDNHDYSWKIDEVGNLVAIPKSVEPLYAFGSHMDTVEPGRGIKPIIKDDIIQTDGTTILGADNKASIAAQLTAIEEYKAKHGKYPPVELLFTVKEESGGGAEFFKASWLKSSKCFIFDYSKSFGKIVKASPFIINFVIALEGKSSHASRPEDGINSLIPTGIDIIRSIPVGRSDEGKTTINVGLIKSGSGVNVIPKFTEIYGEIRSLNKDYFTKHLKDIETKATEIANKNNVKISFNTNGYCGGYEFSDDDLLIGQIKSIYQSLGIETEIVSNTSVSDANSLNDIGIKTINMSESVENPHTPEERISVKNLNRLKEIMLNFLENIK